MIIYKITTISDNITSIVAYTISQKLAENYLVKNNYYPLFRDNTSFFTYTKEGRMDIYIEPIEVLEQ